MIKFSRIRHDGQIKWVEVQSNSIGLVLLNTPFEPDIITSDEEIDLTNWRLFFKLLLSCNLILILKTAICILM